LLLLLLLLLHSLFLFALLAPASGPAATAACPDSPLPDACASSATWLVSKQVANVLLSLLRVAPQHVNLYAGTGILSKHG
jgi:hypothetical protein